MPMECLFVIQRVQIFVCKKTGVRFFIKNKPFGVKMRFFEIMTSIAAPMI